MHDPGLSSRVRFPTTDWGAISAAGGDGATARPALGRLLERYLPALKSYLRVKWRVTGDRCDDLLQGFVAEKVLEQGLIGRAEVQRGRFRNFLMTALDRFLISDFRRGVAARRSPGQGASAAGGNGNGDATEVPGGVGADVFDLAWARQVLDLTLQRMRQSCQVNGREEVWGLFEARVVRPALDGVEPPPYGELLRRFKFESPEQAWNLLATGKRMFQKNLRLVVAEYAADEDDVEDEIRLLRQILGQGSAF
jgi:hypothetical protein